MKHHRLDDMKGGWFLGDFAPCAARSSDAEVGVKRYAAGAREDKHFHKIATELTVIVSGTVRMFDQVWQAGDIITVEPGDATAFEALTDAVTVVVKTPSVPSDKYPA
ncbi:cupin domain-containing protein [Methylobacterium mesophilicum SR1.6/6]|uniref:Cupin domain-containing protein n=1 Tax=Methylobacterium mesophilicum SR1.6/6 TaxID=908290 RepID=A0A6B9FGK6_9HYPH|nr:cupin domain-containing protein [Methylobacterium mesophilicum]QGY01239.1 cupin domain-containing protein [Methylobacterium mesophilicum SR1.6/6]